MTIQDQTEPVPAAAGAPSPGHGLRTGRRPATAVFYLNGLALSTYIVRMVEPGYGRRMGAVMRFMMLIYIDESDERGPAEVTPWAAEQDARGVRQIGSRLRPSSDAKTIALRDGGVLVSDGPFAETKEQIGGFDVLECLDLDEAIEIAASHPGARTGKVELRPLWEDPTA